MLAPYGAAEQRRFLPWIRLIVDGLLHKHSVAALALNMCTPTLTAEPQVHAHINAIRKLWVHCFTNLKTDHHRPLHNCCFACCPLYPVWLVWKSIFLWSEVLWKYSSYLFLQLRFYIQVYQQCAWITILFSLWCQLINLTRRSWYVMRCNLATKRICCVDVLWGSANGLLLFEVRHRGALWLISHGMTVPPGWSAVCRPFSVLWNTLFR